MFAGEVEVQFQDAAQQKHAAELGMWVFMASEALFFSGLFALFAAYRYEYGGAFLEAARHTDLLLGSINTFVLLTSSLLVALSIHAARRGWRRGRLLMLLGGTIALGALFLALKFLEYAHHLDEGLAPGRLYSNTELTGAGAHVFFNLYYAMTGLHAVHMTAGLVLMAWLLRLAYRERLTPSYYTPLELGGIYWHFVDIIWVFLWPLFYLMRAR
jgi:cytochrome c oxidase subunit 3